MPTWSNQGESFRSICYEIVCNHEKETINVLISGSVVECPMSGGLIQNPSGFRGKIVCPDYNSVCTSEIWCNDPLDCIDKKVTADINSYSYKYTLPITEKSKFIKGVSLISIFIIIVLLF